MEDSTRKTLPQSGANSSNGDEIDELMASLVMESPSPSSVLPSPSSFLGENIWAPTNIYNSRGMTLAENRHSGQECPISCSSSTRFTNSNFNHVECSSYGSPRGQSYAGYMYKDSSIQNPAASTWNYQSDVRNFSPVMGNQLSQIGNGGSNNIASSNYFSYQDVMADEFPQRSGLQPGFNILVMARTHDGSAWLQRILRSGDYEYTQTILNGLLDSIFQLMIDENGYHVFGVLVDTCQMNQLRSIVCKVYNEPFTFVQVAITDKGSRSIQKLIQRLKKTALVDIIINILSVFSYTLLTHKTGAHVIRQCFHILGEKPNQVFYDTIISRLLDIATDKVGCISLNNFINSITGPRRKMFLELIAENSLFLSNDPSGNFVVQQILDLNNADITEKILDRLEGNFEQLATNQGGSRVTEKCMQLSLRGLNLVVTELMKNEKTLVRLARDFFGNYVIQTALKQTKMKNKKLYQELVEILKPYILNLLGRTKGKHVAELIRQELKLQQALSMMIEEKCQF